MIALPQVHQFDDATRRNPQVSAVPEVDDAVASPDAIKRLQSQIHRVQGPRLASRILQTHPDLRAILPGGGLRAGSSYTVQNSNSVAMAMLAGPSSAGAWCGVIGVPYFNVEAAAQFGIELERLVLIPYPGELWLGVTAALIDIVSAVLINPPAAPSAGQIARLGARLRQRKAVLICQTPWISSEAELSIAENSWQGIGEGYGQLNGRTVTVTASWRSRRNETRRTELRLPGSMPRYEQHSKPHKTFSELNLSAYPPLSVAVGG